MEDDLSLVPEEYICPLTLELMVEPAMTRHGFNFEMSAILKWLEQHEECPMTRQKLSLRDIVANRCLQRRIYYWQKGNGHDLSSTKYSLKVGNNDDDYWNLQDEDDDDAIPPTSFVIHAKSTRVVMKVLEETNDPVGKSILKRLKKRREEKKRMKQERARAA